MKVLRLVMTSFGGQRNKVIDFSDDVNLIMGKDEQTLQTVEAFIDGMLFGLTAEARKRYRPKQMPYSGIMFVEESDGTQLKLERNFLNNQFTVSDSDGNNVTHDYTDEYGELTVVPLMDSVFPIQPFKSMELSGNDRKKLGDLNLKKHALENRYNYPEMLKERDEILLKLNEQKKLEEEFKSNSDQINQKEARVKAINSDSSQREAEIDEKIRLLNEDIQEKNKKIEELKTRVDSEGSGKAQILQRSIKSTREQIEILDKKIEQLKTQESTYQEKYQTLQDEFPIDRDELKSDYEKYQDELDQQKNALKEPVVDKVTNLSNGTYITLIIIGIAGIAVALANPNDLLSRVPVFLVCFASVFLILVSLFALLIRNKKIKFSSKEEKEIPEENIDLSDILKKYNLDDEQEFNEFYSQVKKVSVRMENIKTDIEDIEKEIKEAEEEKDKLLALEKEINFDLDFNKEAYSSSENQDEIISLTKEINKDKAQIAELKEERMGLEKESIWELKKQAILLEETNSKLKDQVSGGLDIVNEFERVQRRIDRYETKLNEIEKQKREIEERFKKEKRKKILDFADKKSEEYQTDSALEFGFGLQKNLKYNADVPLISFNPLVIEEERYEELVEKLRDLINGKQALIFSTDISDQILFSEKGIPYNGIYIAS